MIECTIILVPNRTFCHRVLINRVRDDLFQRASSARVNFLTSSRAIKSMRFRPIHRGYGSKIYLVAFTYAVHTSSARQLTRDGRILMTRHVACYHISVRCTGINVCTGRTDSSGKYRLTGVYKVDVLIADGFKVTRDDVIRLRVS